MQWSAQRRRELAPSSRSRSPPPPLSPVPLTHSPTHTLLLGPHYLELDLDVHSYAFIARKAYHGFVPRLAPVVFENAFVVQGAARAACACVHACGTGVLPPPLACASSPPTPSAPPDPPQLRTPPPFHLPHPQATARRSCPKLCLRRYASIGWTLHSLAPSPRGRWMSWATAWGPRRTARPPRELPPPPGPHA